MKTPWLTSSDIIDSVKRKIAIPLSQNTYSQNDILAFADEEMAISQVPGILSIHSEYFTTYKVFPLIPNVSRYPIPDRAIGMKVRDVFWMDQSGNLFDMAQIEEHDRAYWQRNTGSTQAIHKFFFEGNDICLAPNVMTSPVGSLVVVFYLRPNQLVKNDRAAIISNFQQTITLNNSLINAYDTINIATQATPFQPAGNVVFTAVTSGGGSITAIASHGSNTLITSANHHLSDGQTVVITGSNSNPSVNGTYQISLVDSNNFTIPIQITTAGTTGSFTSPNQFVIAATSALTAANLAASISSLSIIDNATSINGIVTLSFDNIYTSITPSNTTGFVVPSSTIGINFQTLATTYTDSETNITEPLFGPGVYVDFLQTKPGHKIYVYDVKIPTTGISGTVLTLPITCLYVPTGTVSSGTGNGILMMLAPLVPGDYMSLSNECIIPQIPPDLHNGLAERTASRICAAQGDQQGLQNSQGKIQEIQASQGTLLAQRSDGNPLKVTGRHSLLRVGKSSQFRRG